MRKLIRIAKERRAPFFFKDNAQPLTTQLIWKLLSKWVRSSYFILFAALILPPSDFYLFGSDKSGFVWLASSSTCCARSFFQFSRCRQPLSIVHNITRTVAPIKSKSDGQQLCSNLGSPRRNPVFSNHSINYLPLF